MKKVFSSLLLLFLPILAFGETVEVDGIWYNLLEGNKAELICNPNGYTDPSDPSYYDMSYAYKDAVVIPNSITYGGTVYSVTAIGEEAFFGYNQTSFTIPGNIKKIGSEAFSHSELESVTLSEGIESIDEEAFSACKKLTSVIIPSTTTTIKRYCFSACTSLISVEIGENVVEIEEGAFHKCTSLSSVIIPNNVKTIGDMAFYACSELATVNLGSSLTTIGQFAFHDTKITSITIPSSVTSFDYAFADMPSLTSVKLSEGLQSIGEGSFMECGIKTLDIPNSITTIGHDAFSNCADLESISFGDNVETIAQAAFHTCDNISTIELPASVLAIGDGAFAYHEDCKLTVVKSKIKKPFEVDAFKTVTEQGYFSTMDKVTLYVPVGTKKIYADTRGWNGFKEIIEDESLGVVETEDDFAVSLNEDNTVAIVSCETTDDVAEVPATATINGEEKEVSEISAGAFAGKTNVTDIYLPETDEPLTLGTDALKIDDEHVATVHVPLSLLVDYALNEQLKQNYEAGKVVATLTAPNKYWTFSSGVDVLVPEGVTVYIVKSVNGSDVQIVKLTDEELTVKGKKVIKANNGVLISSVSGNAYDIVANSGNQASGSTPAYENANSYEGNKLVPVVKSEHYSPSEYYMLYEGGFVAIKSDDTANTPACKALLKK